MTSEKEFNEIKKRVEVFHPMFSKVEVVIAEVFKIDEKTGNSYNYRMPVPRMGLKDMLEGKPEDEKLPKVLQSPLRFVKAICNVGDFLIIEGETFRRIRGGWRAATDNDLAELLAAKLGEVLEEKTWKGPKKNPH